MGTYIHEPDNVQKFYKRGSRGAVFRTKPCSFIQIPRNVIKSYDRTRRRAIFRTLSTPTASQYLDAEFGIIVNGLASRLLKAIGQSQTHEG